MRDAPTILIRFELEQPVRVRTNLEVDADTERMRDWLEAHPDHLDLIVRALDLAEEESE